MDFFGIMFGQFAVVLANLLAAGTTTAAVAAAIITSAVVAAGVWHLTDPDTAPINV